MNREQFDEWFAEHCTMFPSCADWLDKRSEADQEKILRRWHEVLIDVKLPHAIKGSERLFRDYKKHPWKYEQWPSRVREKAEEFKYDEREDARKYEELAEADRCEDCSGTGLMEVWADTIKETLKYPKGTSRYIRTTCGNHRVLELPCFCPRGQRRCSDKDFFHLNGLRYDPEVHEVYSMKGWSVRREAHLEIVRQANRETFDAKEKAKADKPVDIVNTVHINKPSTSITSDGRYPR